MIHSYKISCFGHNLLQNYAAFSVPTWTNTGLQKKEKKKKRLMLFLDCNSNIWVKEQFPLKTWKARKSTLISTVSSRYITWSCSVSSLLKLTLCIQCWCLSFPSEWDPIIVMMKDLDSQSCASLPFPLNLDQMYYIPNISYILLYVITQNSTIYIPMQNASQRIEILWILLEQVGIRGLNCKGWLFNQEWKWICIFLCVIC